MGRWSQERRRGADCSEGSSLPAGPDSLWWRLDTAPEEVAGTWLTNTMGLGGSWELRTRDLTLSPTWAAGLPTIAEAVNNEAILNQWPVFEEHIYQGQARWCDSAGNPKSQWGAWQQVLGIE